MKKALIFVAGMALVLSGLYWLGGGVLMRAGVAMSIFPFSEVVHSLAALAELLIGILIISWAMGNNADCDS